MNDDRTRVSTHVEREGAELEARVLREHGIQAVVLPHEDGLLEGEMVWMVAVRPQDRERARVIEATAFIGKSMVKQPDGSFEFV